jgi:transposase-like protein
MRPKFYPEVLKAEAVRLVVERRQTIVRVASQLDIPSEAVRVWVRRYKYSRFRTSEVSRLKTEMHEMAMERNVLVKLASRLIAGSS